MQVRWTNLHRQILIDAMLNEASRGTLTGRGFRKVSWRRIHAEFSIRTRDELKCSNQHLQTQFSELKKKFFLFKELQEAEGFTFDPIKCQLFASPELWRDQITKNAMARRFQHRPMPFYRDLESMFSGTVVGQRKPIDYTCISSNTLKVAAAANRAMNSHCVTQFCDRGDALVKPESRDSPLLLGSHLTMQMMGSTAVPAPFSASYGSGYIQAAPAVSSSESSPLSSAATAAAAAPAPLPASGPAPPPSLQLSPPMSDMSVSAGLASLGYNNALVGQMQLFQNALSSAAALASMAAPQQQQQQQQFTSAFSATPGPLHFSAPPSLPMYGMYNMNPAAMAAAQMFPLVDPRLIETMILARQQHQQLQQFPPAPYGQQQQQQLQNASYFGFASG